MSRIADFLPYKAHSDRLRESIWVETYARVFSQLVLRQGQARNAEADAKFAMQTADKAVSAFVEEANRRASGAVLTEASST